MKNYIECLAEAAAEQNMTIGEVFDNWLDKSYSKIFDAAADIYASQSNSHKHSVMQAEGSDGAEGAAVGDGAAGQNVREGKWDTYKKGDELYGG
jgi:hypothetical protein